MTLGFQIVAAFFLGMIASALSGIRKALEKIAETDSDKLMKNNSK